MHNSSLLPPEAKALRINDSFLDHRDLAFEGRSHNGNLQKRTVSSNEVSHFLKLVEIFWVGMNKILPCNKCC